MTVTVHWRTPAALVIEGAAEALPQRWLLDRLRGLEDQADDETLVITVVSETDDETPRDPARLVIRDPALRDWIRASRPGLFHRDLRTGTRSKLLTRGIGALAAFLLILFVLLPSLADTLALLIPEDREAVGRTRGGGSRDVDVEDSVDFDSQLAC